MFVLLVAVAATIVLVVLVVEVGVVAPPVPRSLVDGGWAQWVVADSCVLAVVKSCLTTWIAKTAHEAKSLTETVATRARRFVPEPLDHHCPFEPLDTNVNGVCPHGLFRRRGCAPSTSVRRVFAGLGLGSS